MNVIESNWKQRKSRIEEGIFFGTDEFIALHGTPSSGYSVAPRANIASLLQSKPDYWCDLGESTGCAVRHGDLSIFGGATSWEAEGFIAVEQSSQLLWLLHLSESEEFVHLSTDGASILGRSGGYPDCFEWRIPISVPEALTIARAART